ncbi:hypothetical protein LXL04_027972 [Taraxacum kok-saghyz]
MFNNFLDELGFTPVCLKKIQLAFLNSRMNNYISITCEWIRSSNEIFEFKFGGPHQSHCSVTRTQPDLQLLLELVSIFHEPHHFRVRQRLFQLPLFVCVLLWVGHHRRQGKQYVSSFCDTPLSSQAHPSTKMKRHNSWRKPQLYNGSHELITDPFTFCDSFFVLVSVNSFILKSPIKMINEVLASVYTSETQEYIIFEALVNG